MNGIRAAAVEDAGEIAAVHVASWRVAYDGLMPASYLDSLDIEARAMRWRTMLAAGDDVARTLVLEVDDQVVGFIAVGAGSQLRFARWRWESP